jgi:hypothetical protein
MMRIKLSQLLIGSLALIMILVFSACNTKQTDTDTEQSSVDNSVLETTTSDNPAVLTSANETTAVTTTFTSAAAVTTVNQQSSICGEYRSVLYSPYIETDEMIEEIINSGEDHMLYDYVNVTMLDDGSFQAAFMSEWIGRYDDYAFYDNEVLGTSAWMSYDSVTSEVFNLGNVTVTADGNTAWVTFEGEEPREYTKTK